ncbi:MAG: hypothetical protein KatS3mg043_0621 [Rhodothermaceae bacterium]|nr:MAG: hypothetical protein KatS3mg043_0621 [Rhodothermaceae bacterium]
MTSPSTDTDTERLTAFHAAAERLAEQAPVLLRTALGSGGAEADLFLEASLYHRITLDGSLRGRSLRLGAPRVERHDVAGLGVRVRRGRAMGYAAAEGLDGTGWHAAAGRAAATFGTGRTRGEARATVHTGRAVLPPRLPPDAPETAGIPEKRILLETAIEAAFAFDERVVRARATYYDRTRRVAVHTSWGRAAATATMLLGLRVEVTLAAGRRGTGTRSVTACAMTGGACGLGHFFYPCSGGRGPRGGRAGRRVAGSPSAAARPGAGGAGRRLGRGVAARGRRACVRGRRGFGSRLPGRGARCRRRPHPAGRSYAAGRARHGPPSTTRPPPPGPRCSSRTAFCVPC